MKNVKLDINNIGRIRLGYAIGFLLLIFAYLGTLYANRRFVDQAKWVEHSNKVIADLETMLAKITDAESGMRGYWMTGNSDFLRPYHDAKKVSNFFFKSLMKETIDNDFQQNKLIELKADIDKRFTLFEDNLEMFNRNNKKITDSLLNAQVQSKAAMDRIRQKVTEMEAKERMLLTERDIKVQKTTSALKFINIVSVLMAAALVVFGFIAHAQENKAKQSAEKQMRDYQDQLKNRIDDLDKANTELIKMRSQEKFAATGRIARTIAHEVRNPLTNINLAVDQLKTEVVVKQDETSKMLFDMINRNSTRINQLISDLLNSTKFSELSYEKVSVNVLLDETLKEAEDRISLTNVQVIKKYSTDVCDVAVDKGKIKIAFLNIIINAIEAMEHKEGSVLTLETKGENDRCKIIIKDNGAGLDSESANRLFEPYFTSKPKGNGLGLTNTQNIILNHKGEISVETIKGKGTCFTITLNFPS